MAQLLVNAREKSCGIWPQDNDQSNQMQMKLRRCCSGKSATLAWKYRLNEGSNRKPSTGHRDSSRKGIFRLLSNSPRISEHGISRYEKDLRRQLRDSECSPSFSKPEFIQWAGTGAETITELPDLRWQRDALMKRVEEFAAEAETESQESKTRCLKQHRITRIHRPERITRFYCDLPCSLLSYSCCA